MTAADGRDYNAGELSDLIAAKDTEIANTQSAYDAIAHTWTSDPTWAGEWATLTANYATERAKAERYISVLNKVPWTDLSGFNADAEYTGVLQSLNPAWPGSYGTGSLQDLEQRLQAGYASLGQTEPGGQPIPQPTPAYDSGLNPTSWEGYVTGIGAKLGFVSPADVPPGTPGTVGGPPLIPTWIKWLVGGAAGLYIVGKAADLKKLI